MVGERNGRKHDVAQDCTVASAMSETSGCVCSRRGVDKIGFGWCLERRYVHSMDSGPISLLFSSNQQVPLKTYNADALERLAHTTTNKSYSRASPLLAHVEDISHLGHRRRNTK